jgi:flagellin
MSTINTNIQSLNAQRNLASSAGSLSTSMQRLSSGLRVNSAKDDAAGLAISERMNAQVKGLNVAARNANDGISLAQTAEGALGKVGDMLQRMRELAVQSANATNTGSDRKAMQSEVSQLKNEIQRVSETTKFNNISLLDGSFSAQNFQVGANAGETITVASIANVATDSIGSTPSGKATLAVSTATELDAVTAGDITIQSATGTAISIGALNTAITAKERTGQIAAAINNVSGQTGVNAFIDEDTGALTLTSKNTIQADAIAASGTATDLAAMGLTTNIEGTSADSAGIDGLDISSYAGATLAMEQLDSALNFVNSSRADLGALQSRFESAAATIQIQGENISSARGRIIDADFAKETANLSRAQILQQAGTAMVAQANQLPQGVLALLR